MEKIKVLLVDDEQDLCQMMKMRLSKEAPSYAFHYVCSGEECLAYLKHSEADCILSDYQMPGMNGMELLVSLREQGNTVPFIFLTGQGNEQVARDAFKNGAEDYFTKDLGFAHFARIINSIEQAVRLHNAENYRMMAEEAERLRLERSNRHHAVMVMLATHPAVTGGDVEEAAGVLTENIANVLMVERVSVWMVENEGSEFRCIDLYERSAARHSNGMVLRQTDYPRYFEALASGRGIAADDARNDPRTSEFRDDYLEPLGITSMLDAPARIDGKLVGIVCHEHVGAPRRWEADEISLAGQAADQISQAMLIADRKAREAELWKSESRFRSFLECCMSGIYIIQDDRIVFVNQTLASIFGYSREEITEHMKMEDFIAPESREETINNLRKRFVGEVMLTPYPIRGLRSDGSVIDLEVFAALTEYDGQPAVMGSLIEVNGRT